MGRIDATMAELRAIATGLGLQPYSKKYKGKESRLLLEDAVLSVAPFYRRTGQDSFDTEEHENRYLDYELGDCGDTVCSKRGKLPNEYLLDVLRKPKPRRKPKAFTPAKKRKSPDKKTPASIAAARACLRAPPGPTYSQSYSDYTLTDNADTVRTGKEMSSNRYILRFLAGK